MSRYVLLHALFLACALSVAGCAGRSSTVEPETHTESHESTHPTRCDSRTIHRFIGQQATAEILEQMRKESGSQTVRSLRPHDPITLDYDSRRLNINIDDDSLIKSVSCG